MQVLGWVIIWKALRIIVGPKTPWKTVMQSLANPIQLIWIVSIRAIVYREQITIRRKRHIVGIARAAGQNQSLRSQSLLIVRQNQFRGAGGDAQDSGSESHIACIRESARVVLYFTVISARATIDVD